jgi:hypothetical protein
MRIIGLMLIAGAVIAAPAAFAQSSPIAAPPEGQPEGQPSSTPIPGASSDTTTVTIAPDPSATAMADPQSAAQFGSPSAVDSPSSPMPFPAGWPAIKPSAKRPNWVKKAPPTNPPANAQPPH